MSSKREEEKNEKIIRGLMKLPPNRRCINCNSLGPQYVCTNFWTFVCMICSGIHREFTHRVKSVSMSKFTSQEVDALQNGGNQRAREIYLKDWDLHRQRQPNSSNVDKVREFIKAVYIDRKFAGGNNSEKPPGDIQSQQNVGDENRRASSYHSFSQSPPYDFEYEDRMNRKNTGSLTRKPGSAHDLYKRKAASFMYSPGRLSEHLYEDRFANEGSSSRVSDYSLSSGGDTFKSAPHSPNLRRDDGISSPNSDSSKEVIDGLRRQTSSTYSEPYAKSDIDRAPLPRPQRTVSSGNVGSSMKNSVSLQSIDSNSVFDICPEPKNLNTPTHNKVSTIPSSSQLPIDYSAGLNLFKDALAMPAPNSATSVDLFEAPRTVASVDLFQNIPQTSCSSSSSFFSQVSQNTPIPKYDEKLSELSEPSNEGWATFDSPQSSPPGSNTLYTAGLGAGLEGGISYSNFSSVAPSNAELQWPYLQNSAVNSAPSMVSNPWNEGLHNNIVSTNMPSNQIWKAFEDIGEEQYQCLDMQGIKLQVSVSNTPSGTDMFYGLKTSQDSGINGLQNIAFSEGFSFPTLPSHVTSGSSFVEPVHSFMSERANIGQKSDNPFDLPFDSELEVHNTFLDMSTLQAALPSTSLPSSYMGGVNEPWFPANPVAPPGGMSYMTKQAPSLQLPSVPAHGPVASVGGNPFA